MDEYRKQLNKAKLRVGLVVTGALAVLFFTILFAGNLGELFASRTTIYAAFDGVKGLQRGAPVWFAGVQVGAVNSIQFTFDKKVQVAMSMDKGALAYLKRDSRATILTLGLLGDKYVEMSPGSKEAEGLAPGGSVEGMTRPEVSDEVSRLVKGAESEKSSLGRLLREDELYREFLSSVREIKRFAETLNKSQGTFNKFVKDPELYERFLKAAQSLDAVSGKLASSKGTMNRLIEDESLYVNMNAAMVKMNILLDRINKGEGTVGRLMTDRQLADDLDATVKEMEALVKDMKENPKKYFKVSLF